MSGYIKAGMITERQKDYLSSIYVLTRARGFPPTLREVAQATARRSHSTVFYMVERLQTLGLVQHQPRIARSLILTERGYSEIADRARPRAAHRSGQGRSLLACCAENEQHFLVVE